MRGGARVIGYWREARKGREGGREKGIGEGSLLAITSFVNGCLQEHCISSRGWRRMQLAIAL